MDTATVGRLRSTECGTQYAMLVPTPDTVLRASELGRMVGRHVDQLFDKANDNERNADAEGCKSTAVAARGLAEE